MRSYAKWFGVDLLCAATELQLLGVPLSQEYLDALRTTVRERSRKRKKPIPAKPLDDLIDSDESFAFIAGYTPDGVPYGVPWEEELAGLDDETPRY